MAKGAATSSEAGGRGPDAGGGEAGEAGRKRMPPILPCPPIVHSANCRVAAKAAPCRPKARRGEWEMSDRQRESAAPVEPYFDRTPQPFGDGPPEPLVYDASPRALRQRTVNFAAKRL